ncbi:MAG TPA: type II toxin-antitoxin system Phd/YefM family antitoxin [Thermoanaerobaculia bacterium]|nr:type II toxin-antitoxin system Phd/YefM family antitoxin [Thermoanaerobaculia bacterium]
MMKRVKISELKAHLSKYLRHVRKGNAVEVYDRETLVARMVPADEIAPGLIVRRGKGRLQDVRLPPPLDPKIDAVALLREDRDRR